MSKVSINPMKAILVESFGAPEVMQVAERPDPQPGPGQVLVRVEAAGINPVETYIRSGNYARKPNLPFTPGTDGAGTVAAVGEGVTAWAPGQRVYLSGSLTGTYAQLTLCSDTQVHVLPEAISFSQGAALGVPYATAHYALFTRAQAKAGETVLVHGGTGGVGLAAIQLAKAAGLTVFATGSTEAGRTLARENGADQVFDHSATDYLDQMLAATSGKGFDVILEMLANVNLGKDLTVLAPRGRVAVIGSRGPVEINPRDLMSRTADIRGVMLFAASADELAAAHTAIVAGLSDGSLRPVIGQELPLSQAPQAHEAVMSSGARGKIVLLPGKLA